MLLHWNLADVPELSSLALNDAQQAVFLRVANSSFAVHAEHGVAVRSADDALLDDGITRIPHVLFEAHMSFDDRRSALEQAIQAAIPRTDDNDGGYIWVVDVYEDSFVYEDNRTSTPGLYRRSYVMDEDGSVTLGAPAKVSRQTLYVPVEESQKPAVWQRIVDSVSGLFRHEAQVELHNELTPLIEKSVRADGTVPIKIIAPGWGSSAYYPAEVLERDGPKVFTKGIQMFLDHPTESEDRDRPERSVRDLVGALASDARYDENGPAGPGLYADAAVVGPFKDALDELAPHIGVSIRSFGVAPEGEAEGRKGPVLERFDSARSVDFVTAAGAGGKVLPLMESIRKQISEGARPKEGSMPTETELKEARDATTTAQKELVDLKESQAKQTTELARLQETEVLREAVTVATEALGKVEHLPEITQKRLVESLSKNPPVLKDGEKSGKLDRDAFATAIEEAAKSEIAYLASLTESGKIAGMGEVGETDSEANLKSLEESFTAIMGDPELGKAAAKGR
ncbi:MAG: hypothetical protein IIC73_05505 [Armatimonadetes bacterium]|nr:hypothetical protein [Armatimonadota bacterium]